MTIPVASNQLSLNERKDALYSCGVRAIGLSVFMNSREGLFYSAVVSIF
jgi:hypothetical protein